MVDGLKDVVPTLILAAGTGIITYIFGRNKYRRDKSQTELSEAQDSEQMLLLTTLREREAEALRRERETYLAYLAAREELSNTREKMNSEMHELRNEGLRRDQILSRQSKQLSTLAKMIATARPELRELIQESGFVAFDELPTRRKTDPSALPGPIKLDFNLDEKKDRR